jgi:hypothetical protein
MQSNRGHAVKSKVLMKEGSRQACHALYSPGGRRCLVLLEIQEEKNYLFYFIPASPFDSVRRRLHFLVSS